MRDFLSVIACVYCLVTAAAPISGQQIYAAQQSALGKSKVSLSGSKITIRQALGEVAKQANLKLVVDEEFQPLAQYISVKLDGVNLTDALKRIMRGTGAIAYVTSNGQTIVLQRDTERAANSKGVITGKVIDGKTGQGIAGANVVIGDSRKAASGDDGSYRLTEVAAGTYIISARLVGYAKQSRKVTVGDGATVTADFELEPSANVLDQVIVTGTIVQTELKAVPNAITVVTAKQIEERGITKIDQLFRGDIPGIFSQNRGEGNDIDQVTMFSRGAVSLNQAFSSTIQGTATIKTYIDGVELADPTFLNQVDPKSIERIEILTGPQASTIYGSNAINGVMQIFTKRGMSRRPRMHFNILSGVVQNNYSKGKSSQHDYDLQVDGSEGSVSYRAGVAWNYVGPWTPAKQTSRVGTFGGVRAQKGPLQIDASARTGVTLNKSRGGNGQAWIEGAAKGQYVRVIFPAQGLRTTTLRGQTSGVTLNYTPLAQWSHEAIIGNDVTQTEGIKVTPTYQSRTDSSLSFSQNRARRLSLRYVTTVSSIVSIANVKLTGGVDSWQSTVSSLSASPSSLTGTLNGTISIARQPDHNRGAFLQAQVGLWENLNLTYGMRAEWNPNYGEEAQPNIAPRYGLAYTTDFGALTTKLRATYGRSTHPPLTSQKTSLSLAQYFNGSTTGTDLYGFIDQRFANPDLGPEYQQGGEGGIELYWGNRGSVIVTRYNQTADALIASAVIDSARSINTFPSYYNGALDINGYGYVNQYQNVNIGSIRNQGWELQGTTNVGRLSAKGTYTWSKSRMLGITPRYRAQFPATIYPGYQPGASFGYLPEHTWATTISYSTFNTNAALTLNCIGQIRSGTHPLAFEVDNLRLLSEKPRATLPSLIGQGPSYSTADLNASRRLSPSIYGVLQINNLTNYYRNDYALHYATIGRQTKIGLRIR